MKILFLAARQPYPVIKGDQRLTYEQIKCLGSQHDVYLLTFLEYDKDDFYEEMNKYCKKIWTIKDSSLKKLAATSKGFLNGQSFQMNMFHRQSMESLFNEVVSEIQPDIVHVQTFRMSEYVKAFVGIKSIDVIDAYSLNMLKRKDGAKGAIRLLWAWEYKRLRCYEQLMLNYFDIKTIVAQRDKDFMGDDSIIVNPNGVDFHEQVIKQTEKSPFTLIFHGNMSYYPNVKAAQFLITKVLPGVKSRIPETRVYIIGANPDKSIRQHQSEDVIVTGFVKEKEAYIAKGHIAIYPVFSATGIQNKVLEAMDMAVPCIISSQCKEGIPGLIKEEHTLIGDDAETIIQHILFLHDHPEAGIEMAQRAKRFINEQFSWKSHVQVLETQWETCMKVTE